MPQIVATPYGNYTANKYFVGGVGAALGQVFRNNFPSQSIGGGMQIQALDRVAEADYAIDQLTLRQQQLGVAKSTNQAQVDIMNAVVALRQARARYEAAVQSRMLQQQLYEAEQKKLAAGESTVYNVTQQQRDSLQGSRRSCRRWWDGRRRGSVSIRRQEPRSLLITSRSPTLRRAM